jgi:hypothetical protein
MVLPILVVQEHLVKVILVELLQEALVVALVVVVRGLLGHHAQVLLEAMVVLELRPLSLAHQ